jgi:L1 cell adhesion molecule like protein
VSEVKRLIGRQYNDASVQSDAKLWPFQIVPKSDHPVIQVEFRGETKLCTPEEISAMVLGKLKRMAEDYLAEEVTEAVITVPAYFNDAQRRATRDAGAIAGLNVIRVLNEPTAAAMAYGLHKQAETKTVLVFDLGGGTFDVSLLELDAGTMEVLATAGDTHLGGMDFDSQLVSWCVTEFKKKSGLDPTPNTKAMSRLRSACVRAKCTLSSEKKAYVEVDGLCGGKDLSLIITRACFEELCKDYFKRTLDLVEKVLRDGRLAKSKVDEVVMVGGSSRIPKIQHLVSQFFDGKTLNKSVHPDEAVAFGAAVQAAILTVGGEAPSGLLQMVLLDVTPLSLGIETDDGLFAVGIPRNSPIPTRLTEAYRTRKDNQTEVLFSVFEGERVEVKHNHKLGEIVLYGVPPMPRGVAKMDVTFSIDLDGILTVIAFERSTKVSASVSIRNSGSLDQKEIERMLAEESAWKDQEDAIRVATKARDDLERACLALKRSLTMVELGDKRGEVDKKISDTLSWLISQPRQSIGAYTAARTDLEAFVEPFVTDAKLHTAVNQMDEVLKGPWQNFVKHLFKEHHPDGTQKECPLDLREENRRGVLRELVKLFHPDKLRDKGNWLWLQLRNAITQRLNGLRGGGSSL